MDGLKVISARWHLNKTVDEKKTGLVEAGSGEHRRPCGGCRGGRSLACEELTWRRAAWKWGDGQGRAGEGNHRRRSDRF